MLIVIIRQPQSSRNRILVRNASQSISFIMTSVVIQVNLKVLAPQDSFCVPATFIMWETWTAMLILEKIYWFDMKINQHCETNRTEHIKEFSFILKGNQDSKDEAINYFYSKTQVVQISSLIQIILLHMEWIPSWRQPSLNKRPNS